MLEILDVSNPYQIQSLSSINAQLINTLYGWFENLVVNFNQSLLFVASGEKGLLVLNISNPSNPD